MQERCLRFSFSPPRPSGMNKNNIFSYNSLNCIMLVDISSSLFILRKLNSAKAPQTPPSTPRLLTANTPPSPRKGSPRWRQRRKNCGVFVFLGFMFSNIQSCYGVGVYGSEMFGVGVYGSSLVRDVGVSCQWSLRSCINALMSYPILDLIYLLRPLICLRKVISLRIREYIWHVSKNSEKF